MITAVIVLVALSVGACLGLIVGGLCAIQKDPAASRIPLPDVGGSRGGFDLLPFIPGSSHRVPASPLAVMHPVTGRGLNKDYYCADDVAITITDKEIWLEVDSNLLRVKRIKRLLVNDRRTA